MDSNTPASTAKKTGTAIAVLLAIVLLVVGAEVATKKHTDTGGVVSDAATNRPADTDNNTTDAPATDTSNTAAAHTYKNGTYTADGSYNTPGGVESITLQVTVTDDTVTATTLTQHPTNRDSREYQGAFASGYKAKVVGKALDSIHLSRVSGSSLTSEGFNNALATIANQAKA